MIKVKQVLMAVIVATFIFSSFSVNAQQVKPTKGDVIEVKQKLNKMMSVFVKNTSPFYKEGMTFNNFKVALTGKKRSVMSKEGEALLNKSFSYLENSSSSKNIIKYDSSKEMAAALLFTINYNKQHKNKKGELALFGKTTGDFFPNNALRTAAECRWYQLACWWNAIFGEYAGLVIDALIFILNP